MALEDRSRSANVPTRLVCHTKFSEKSTQISGEKFWRKIPIDIRNSESLNIFKIGSKVLLLKSHMMTAMTSFLANNTAP